MDWLIRRAPLPVINGIMGGFDLLARLHYRLPANHMRRTLESFCRLTGRDDAARLFSEFRRNFLGALSLYARLVREGTDAVVDKIVFDEESLRMARKAHEVYSCGIFVVPHCAGSVLSASGFGREFPSVVLVRESKSEKRAMIFRQYFEKLGPEIFYVRRNDPASIARGILRALHDKKFIIGTTDLARKTADTVPVTVFGEQVHMPSWPARFSARRNVPIIPAYVRMQDGGFVVSCDEPYIEKDLTASTQRWTSCFEENFRRFPSDWLFMFDKRWSRIIERAAARA
jgi:lauroyl/myristoyl acyltransferase